MTRAALAILALAVGIIFLAFGGTELVQNYSLGPVQALGALLVLCGFAGVLYATVNRLVEPAEAADTDAEALALRAIEALEFAHEATSSSKNASELFGKLFSLEDSDSRTLKRRDFSAPDLAANLRELLLAVSYERRYARVIVAIDELDKLSSSKELISTINGLKDLFHIRGVHFLVAVSTDALESFLRRGLPARDAFDSSFDSIIGVPRLSVRESQEVLLARAAGFPPLLGLFCHAWSGGLPRDLLRLARRAVELQRASPTALTVEELVSSLVREDCIALIESEIRRAMAGFSIEHLQLLRTQFVRWGSGDPLPSAVESSAGVDESLHVTIVMGIGISRYFVQRASKVAVWNVADEEAMQVCESVASAIGRRADAATFREEALAAAISALNS